jgi:PIN domain nuclease of toxin-antitoxin system
MRILLDTHAVIWFLDNNPSLSETAKKAIEDAENELFVSTVTLWELAIKISIGKLRLAYSLEKSVEALLQQNVQVLSFDLSHVLRVESLAFHHKDPFDRMLIAQSLVDNLTFISNESLFESYGVSRLW